MHILSYILLRYVLVSFSEVTTGPCLKASSKAQRIFVSPNLLPALWRALGAALGCRVLPKRSRDIDRGALGRIPGSFS